MLFNTTQRRLAYKKLPEEVQYFISDSETMETTDAILTKQNFTEDVADKADSQILYAMVGLQTLDDAIADISKISGKTIAELSPLKAELIEKIFSKYPELGKVQNVGQNEVGGMKSTTHNDSDLPMIEVGEVVHDVKPQAEALTATPTQTPTPTPQPVKPLEERKASVSVPQSSYKPGQDPYREPIG